MLKKFLFIIMFVSLMFEACATGQIELPIVRKPKAFQGINRNLPIPLPGLSSQKARSEGVGAPIPQLKSGNKDTCQQSAYTSLPCAVKKNMLPILVLSIDEASVRGIAQLALLEAIESSVNAKTMLHIQKESGRVDQSKLSMKDNPQSRYITGSLRS